MFNAKCFLFYLKDSVRKRSLVHLQERLFLTVKFRVCIPKTMIETSVLLKDSYNLIMILGEREPRKSKANVRK